MTVDTSDEAVEAMAEKLVGRAYAHSFPEYAHIAALLRALLSERKERSCAQGQRAEGTQFCVMAVEAMKMVEASKQTADQEFTAKIRAQDMMREAEAKVADARQERDAALGRVKVLEEALKPFARFAEAYDLSDDDDGDNCWDSENSPNLGLLRRARAALEAK
jgi:hypothetical protein